MTYRIHCKHATFDITGADGTAAAVAQDGGGVELDRGCAYYTCDGTQQLDAQFGDLQHKIQDLEVSAPAPHRQTQCVSDINRLTSL